jgi:head-tail adaptor
MRAGKLDRRVTFLHMPNGTGPLVERCRLWAEWRPLSASQKVEAHGLTDGIEGQLRVRDTAVARSIVQTDRAHFVGQDFAVLSTPVPDRSGYLWIKIGRQLGGGSG